jgi:2-polyprenyl-6-methoxyphenol hydroxylase-like FAD-dependent oxidoreductase
MPEAWNLAWKLALVERGRARPELLDSYHAERFPVAGQLLRFTDRMFQAALGCGFLSRIGRSLLLPLGLLREVSNDCRETSEAER